MPLYQIWADCGTRLNASRVRKMLLKSNVQCKERLRRFSVSRFLAVNTPFQNWSHRRVTFNITNKTDQKPHRSNLGTLRSGWPRLQRLAGVRAAVILFEVMFIGCVQKLCSGVVFSTFINCFHEQRGLHLKMTSNHECV